ncbi:mannonate dehydratase [Maribacter vaceletii]|nr:mannonate dehydratase [Maribacter vaceletii]
MTGLEDGSMALRFDKVEMAIFEKYIMNVEVIEEAYTSNILKRAEILFSEMTTKEKHNLQERILMGLPGIVNDLTIPVFKIMIAQYDNLSHSDLKRNLSYFLKEVIPVCEENDMTMGIHPGDPPIDIMGLPRIIKSEQDLEDLVNFVDSPANGITFCTGALGANPDNNLPKMIRMFGDRIHFIHLRNVRLENKGSFFEDNHLEGSTDMYEVVKAIIEVETRRGLHLPMRSDHGHQMLDDLKDINVYSGYSAIGRLRGLAELRVLALGIIKVNYRNF